MMIKKIFIVLLPKTWRKTLKIIIFGDISLIYGSKFFFELNPHVLEQQIQELASGTNNYFLKNQPSIKSSSYELFFIDNH